MIQFDVVYRSKLVSEKNWKNREKKVMKLKILNLTTMPMSGWHFFITFSSWFISKRVRDYFWFKECTLDRRKCFRCLWVSVDQKTECESCRTGIAVDVLSPVSLSSVELFPTLTKISSCAHGMKSFDRTTSDEPFEGASVADALVEPRQTSSQFRKKV